MEKVLVIAIADIRQVLKGLSSVFLNGKTDEEALEMRIPANLAVDVARKLEQLHGVKILSRNFVIDYGATVSAFLAAVNREIEVNTIRQAAQSADVAAGNFTIGEFRALLKELGKPEPAAHATRLSDEELLKADLACDLCMDSLDRAELAMIAERRRKVRYSLNTDEAASRAGTVSECLNIWSQAA